MPLSNRKAGGKALMNEKIANQMWGRESTARITSSFATLIRLIGDFDLAEEATRSLRCGCGMVA